LVVMTMLSVCGASLTPAFWYERPTYWWKANYTTADSECGSVMFCEAGQRPNLFSYLMMQTNDVKTSLYSMMTSNISLPKMTSSLKSVTSSPGPLSPAPVNVTFYYEPVCLGNQDTHTKLARTPMAKSKFTASASTHEQREHKNSSLSCQHSCTRSLQNKIESCATRYAGNDTKESVLACLEYYGATLVNAKYCTSVYNVPWKPVYRCLTGYQGKRLVCEMRATTVKVSPRPKYFPLFAVKMQKHSRKNMFATLCRNATLAGMKPVIC